MQRALQQCCQQLRVKLRHAAALKDKHERKQNLTKYIPNVASSIFSVLTVVTDEYLQDGQKRRRLEGKCEPATALSGLLPNSLTTWYIHDSCPTELNCVEISQRSREETGVDDLVHKVHGHDITQATIRKRLEAHVEQVALRVNACLLKWATAGTS